MLSTNAVVCLLLSQEERWRRGLCGTWPGLAPRVCSLLPPPPPWLWGCPTVVEQPVLFLVLTSLPSAFPVNGDVVGAVDMEEERSAAGTATLSAGTSSTADGSVTASTLPALPGSTEAEEAAPSTPQARTTVLAQDSLPPG